LYTYEQDKFKAGGFEKMSSEIVQPPSIRDCPIQLEAMFETYSVLDYDDDGAEDTAAVIVKVVNVRAHADIVAGENHINPGRWSPLIYNFRHYYGLGEYLGKTFKAEV